MKAHRPVLFVLLSVVLGVAAWSAGRWLPWSIGFVTQNTDFIQGLTDLVQLVMWIVAAGAFVLGLWRPGNWGERVRSVPAGTPGPAEPTVGERSNVINGNVKGSVIVSGDHNIVGSTGDGPRVDEQALEHAYLSQVLAQARKLNLPGIDPQMATGAGTEHQTQLQLDAVYTALLTRTSAASDEERNEIRNKIAHGLRDEDRRNYAALAHMDRSRRLVLLGEPGSGKSTFLNYVAACMAGELVGDERTNLDVLRSPLPPEPDRPNSPDSGAGYSLPQFWAHGALLPVPVILRDFAAAALPPAGVRATADHLWSFIEGTLERMSLEDYAPVLRRRLLEDGGLILLDGLDEVPDADERRLQLKEVVESFASTFGRCRFLVTSRIYAYENQAWHLQDFEDATLAPFTQGQIVRFVDLWYAHVGDMRSMTPDDARGRADLLKTAVMRSDRLRELAERPLLLTLMASLHALRGGSLPDQREKLYDETVQLLMDHWDRQRVVYGLDGKPRVIQPSLAEYLKVERQDDVRKLLERLAYEAHSAQTEITGTADIAEADLVDGLMYLSPDRRDVKPSLLIEYLCDRAGILVPHGVKVYTFPHRTFQEYLAACHLCDLDYPDRVADHARAEPDRWREVALLAAAKQARGGLSSIWLFTDAMVRGEPPATAESGGLVGAAEAPDTWGAFLAGLALASATGGRNIPDWKREELERIKRWQLYLMGDDSFPATDRAAAGDALARLGDPRFDEERWYLPADETLGFERVEAGEFEMGGESYDDEKPRHTLTLETFYMARYPVTVAQFRAFVEENGIQPVEKDSLGGVDNHPVVLLTWHEALAYSRWLDGQMRTIAPEMLARAEGGPARELWSGLADGRLNVTLPSEAEWEKAARGTDGREYPWVGVADPNRANYDETGIGTTSAVGCFQGGSSPFGCEDMSGNVWEWTRSLWGKEWGKPEYGYPYEAAGEEQGRERLSASDKVLRVLRGGSFVLNDYLVRCACRIRDNPRSRGRSAGFRVVVSPFPLDSEASGR